MEELELGPNGGLVYCMEYLLDNMDWLKDELDKFDDDEYIIFDCPGQVLTFLYPSGAFPFSVRQNCCFVPPQGRIDVFLVALVAVQPMHVDSCRHSAMFTASPWETVGCSFSLHY